MYILSTKTTGFLCFSILFPWHPLCPGRPSTSQSLATTGTLSSQKVTQASASNVKGSSGVRIRSEVYRNLGKLAGFYWRNRKMLGMSWSFSQKIGKICCCNHVPSQIGWDKYDECWCFRFMVIPPAWNRVSL